MIGTRLAHYEITSHIGSGGMGDVYQATDTKLGRSVAIKFLPEAFSHDTERLARFQREARVLASLNHSNIAGIYGVEEIDSRHFLVMELVAGETLAERIQRGPIPPEEALPIAKQIAEALEEAHEKGIIHRDLKPANIKMTREGKVKVLDFGLAKAYEREQVGSTVSNSPTISMAATNAGLILGTAAYMSPEQARGRAVDKRTDLWALGCVLYEMLTGKAAFSGEDVTEILASVVKSEPAWSLLPNATPAPIRKLLRRCLEKDRKRRLESAADARLEIEDVLSAPLEADTSVAFVSGPTELLRNRGRLAWGLVALLAVSLVATIVLLSPWRTTPLTEPVRVNAELGADISLASNNNGNSSLAVSPDGTVLAFVGTANGVSQIYIRRLGQLQASPLAGTSGASSPFFSPDGQWLAFFADGAVKKILVTGGAPVTLADAPAPRGGSWGDDGNIVFHTNPRGGLLRVSSAGGKAEPLTKLGEGEINHRWPQVLPGAKAVLYISTAVGNNAETSNIVVQSLPSGTPKVLVRGGYRPQYAVSGHLLYIHEGTLFAAPFDLNRLEVTGQSVPAVEGVSAQPGIGAAQFAVSQTGAFTYLSGPNADYDNPVLWMTHDGKTSPLRSITSDWGNPHFSPDGQRLAMDIFSGNNPDVWIYEWARDTLTRLTFDPGYDRNPVWTPDGKRIVFASNRAKRGLLSRTQDELNLYWQRADGTGEVQRLTESPYSQTPLSFHPSGKYLAFSEDRGPNSRHLMILPIEGDEGAGWKPGKPSVFLSTPAYDGASMFSPDGRWIAYASAESGRSEVFVRPFPGPGGKWQISTAGGLDAA